MHTLGLGRARRTLLCAPALDYRVCKSVQAQGTFYYDAPWNWPAQDTWLLFLILLFLSGRSVSQFGDVELWHVTPFLFLPGPYMSLMQINGLRY